MSFIQAMISMEQSVSLHPRASAVISNYIGFTREIERQLRDGSESCIVNDTILMKDLLAGELW